MGGELVSWRRSVPRLDDDVTAQGQEHLVHRALPTRDRTCITPSVSTDLGVAGGIVPESATWSSHRPIVHTGGRRAEARHPGEEDALRQPRVASHRFDVRAAVVIHAVVVDDAVTQGALAGVGRVEDKARVEALVRRVVVDFVAVDLVPLRVVGDPQFALGVGMGTDVDDLRVSGRTVSEQISRFSKGGAVGEKIASMSKIDRTG